MLHRYGVAQCRLGHTFTHYFLPGELALRETIVNVQSGVLFDELFVNF